MASFLRRVSTTCFCDGSGLQATDVRSHLNLSPAKATSGNGLRVGFGEGRGVYAGDLKEQSGTLWLRSTVIGLALAKEALV